MLLFAQQAAADPQQSPGGGLLSMLPLMAAMILIWWLLVLRPQSKAEKARRAKLDAVKKGDRVRTRGGIEGVVARVQDDKVVLRIDVEGKVHVPFAKTYIEDVLTEESAAESSETK
jgi:preprotein translocase subunit YajC